MINKQIIMNENYTIFEFNYASFKLIPYSGQSGSSSRLMKEIILKLRENDFPNEKRIIDRYKNRKGANKRELVIIANRFGDKGLRCFGRIALIKNKAPLLLVGSNIIEEIEKEKNKRFIEISNYSINFSNEGDPIVMFEFNNEGPRLSDFEFYIRQIGKDFNIAKNINYILHLNTEFDKLDKSIQNVFNVTVKVSSFYSNNASWFKALKNINEDTGYRDVRVELFYKRAKEENGKFIKNIKGLDFAHGIFNWLRKDRNNIEYLDDLKMSYQLNDSDEIIESDFIKDKVTSVIKVPLAEGKLYRTTDFDSEVGQEFNFYLRSGKTNFELNKE